MSFMENLTAKNKVITVGVEAVLRNPNQPRKIFEEAPLLELAESIRSCGIIQPLTVRTITRTN